MNRPQQRCTDKQGTETQGNALDCRTARRLFSSYLDGAVTGAEMFQIEKHLSACGTCLRLYRSLQMTQESLASLGRPRPPADLGLKLRVAISREAALVRRSRLEGFMVRMQNALEAFMVPVAAGFVSALIIFGIAMVYFVAPTSLQANNDVPLVMLNAAPQLQQSAFGASLSTINDDSLVIEAYVDANGRVQDYRVLSDPDESKEVSPEVKSMLVFSTFRPARSMGRPTASRAVLSFSKISVRG
jgi:hypothetical protein